MSRVKSTNAGKEIVSANMADEAAVQTFRFAQKLGKQHDGAVALSEAVNVVEGLEIVKIQIGQCGADVRTDALVQIFADQGVTGQTG